MSFCRRYWLCAILLGAVCAIGGRAWGQSAWYEGFEDGAPTWRKAGANAPHRLLDHQRVRGAGAHTGGGCEWLRLAAERGTYIHLSHDAGRPRVIEDLMPSVWIKSDRPGIKLLLQITLPRTQDRRTNRPLSTLLAGSNYTDVGRWQQLRITDVPRLLARQIRVLHAQLGPNVDGREAYVEAVLLNVYGGPGVTNVWIDDLDVAGYVGLNPAATPRTRPYGGRQTTPPETAGSAAELGRRGAAESAAARPSANPVSLTPERRPSSTQVPHYPTAPPALSPPPAPYEIKLVGSELRINEHAIFPRAIEYQGEPLGYLKQLGFNAVWLKRLPAPEFLEEASRWGLWVICPPPRPVPGDSPAPGGDLTEIGPIFNAVLMWNLGEHLTAEHLEATRVWARQIRAADRRMSRPLIGAPIAESRSYSRLFDLLLIDRRPLGTSLELKDYGTWVRRRPLLARLGTSVWTTVQTQLDESWQRQIVALEPGARPPDGVSYEQMRLMAYTAVASGTRGLLFLSSRPLDAPDPAAQRRAAALELVNLELALVEPWAAAGSHLTTAEEAPSPVVGTVLRTKHARLLLPLWYSPGAQYVPGASSATKLSMVVPGVPESCKVYEINPGGLHPLRHLREAGGTRVTLDQFSLAGQVLLAHDPLILAGVTRQTAALGRQSAQLQRELAGRKLQSLRALVAPLGPRTTAEAKIPSWLEAAGKSLQACDRALASGNLYEATLASAQALKFARQIERSYWEFAARGLVSPVSSPPAVSFATLPLHWRLIERIRAARFGPNLLPGGDFEDFDQMWNHGWRHGKYPAPGLQSDAALMSSCARAGGHGLRLSVTAEQPESPPAMIECPPQWFTSPPLSVTAGQWICIHGWINVPHAITGSVDGLMIYDSLGGEALAERVGQTTGWREFALYRVVPQTGPLTVTFALTGLGEAWIDNVQVQILNPEPHILNPEP